MKGDLTMRPMPFSERTPIPVIEYQERFVTVNQLHTQANGYRCRNEGCPCQAEESRRAMEGDTGKMARMEREWESPKCEDAR